MKTALAVLAELIKGDAFLKLAQGSVLLLLVSLVAFLFSVPHLCFILLLTHSTLLVTQKQDTQQSNNGKFGLFCNYLLTA